MPDPTTTRLQLWLTRLNAGDSAAREELFRHTAERLRRLARRMLQNDFPRLRQFEETDDVFQSAIMRLHRALGDVQPASLQDFYRLAGVQLRRVLMDLARHYYGPRGTGTNMQPQQPGEESAPAFEGECTTYEPGALAGWNEFHQAVETLPEDEKQVVDHVWYQEHSLPETADLLGVSLSTIKRRWMSARLKLQTKLGVAEIPDSEASGP